MVLPVRSTSSTTRRSALATGKAYFAEACHRPAAIFALRNGCTIGFCSGQKHSVVIPRKRCCRDDLPRRSRPTRCKPQNPGASPTASSNRRNGPEVEGWMADDHQAAFVAFQTSCRPFLKSRDQRDMRPVAQALLDICRRAAGARISNVVKARAFFEDNFQAGADCPSGRAGRLFDGLLRADRPGLALSKS